MLFRVKRLNLFGFILSCRGKGSPAPWEGLHFQPPGNKSVKGDSQHVVQYLVVIEDDPLGGVLLVPYVADIVAGVV